MQPYPGVKWWCPPGHDAPLLIGSQKHSLFLSLARTGNVSVFITDTSRSLMISDDRHDGLRRVSRCRDRRLCRHRNSRHLLSPRCSRTEKRRSKAALPVLPKVMFSSVVLPCMVPISSTNNCVSRSLHAACPRPDNQARQINEIMFCLKKSAK